MRLKVERAAGCFVVAVMATAVRSALAQPAQPPDEESPVKPPPVAAPPAEPPADPNAEVLRRLEANEARLARQQAEIDELRAKLATRDQQGARAAAERAAAARDLAGRVRVSGYVHVDWVAMRESSEDEVDASTGEPLNSERFLIRRARVRAEGEDRFVGGSVELDGNTVRGAQARVIGAEVFVRAPAPDNDAPPYAMATIGLFKVPFGAEVPSSEKTNLFLERTNVMRALFPGNYDLGMRLSGGWRFVRYAFAAMNGAPIGERQFPGQDPTESKDLVARLGAEASASRWVNVQAGVSFLGGEGFHEGTPSTKDVLVWRDANQNGLVENTEIQVIAGAAATPSETFERFALGADARVSIAIPWLGDLSLAGEIVWAENLDRGIFFADPVAVGRDLREIGGAISLTQEVTRYAMLGVRYDRYDPDADASEQIAVELVPLDSSLSTLAVVAALRWPLRRGPTFARTPGAFRAGAADRARLLVEYDHNDNPFGRTPAGMPTTLADDALTLRAEVTF